MSLTGVPVHCNVLWQTAEKALAAPRGDLRLGFCSSCGHVYNMAFDPALMEYTQSYENSLHFSPRFQAYAKALADRLISTYAITGKDVIDIGCGKGDFLAMLCLQGENRGVGFDPSYVPEYMEANAAARMEIVRDFYSPRYTKYSADLLTCRHVLEHIQAPRDFVRNVRDAVGDRTQSIVFFEVPNVLYTLRDLGIWDLIYEHCSYFSRWSLARVFSEERFQVIAEEELYESQFLGIDLKPVPETRRPSSPVQLGSMPEEVNSFARHYQQKVQHWQKVFSQLKEKGKRAAVWGGGSKGTMFLNTLKPGESVACMVDINPRKQGMFVAGTGYPVVGPDRLAGMDLDTIIVMNPIYREEIMTQVDQLGISVNIMVA
ncbi:MAG: class I SAM-dependent methyltransferase [Bacteroidota bacterium]